MKPVPRKPRDDEDSITELKKQNESLVKLEKEQDDNSENETATDKKENGYLTVIKNVPFLCLMLANLPAVMGLYIPYMFLPGVSS